MTIPNKETVEELRLRYPIGSRVELVKMDDPQAPPIGTCGTVRGVAATGSLLVPGDHGGGRPALSGGDGVRKSGG